ncbi:MAG TPA: hypothetical protein VFQ89_04655 [Candidatus Binatia bacterium]|nr:hypothetical protein [Candidatus Binatia bacterium]
MKIAGYLALLLTWTLWIRTISPSSDTWSAAPGLASEDKCLASVKDKLDMWKQFKDAKFENNTVIFTSNSSSMSYLCLPEEDDPRKPAKAPKPVK